jgi:hypothetical protein
MEAAERTTIRNLEELASHPSIIKGIHEACDQWCTYCPATKHCLVFRYSDGLADSIEWDTSGTTGNDLAANIVFVKTLAQVEGRRAPPEIEVVLSRGPREHIKAALSDPLENLGRTYMDVAEAYLASRPDVPFEIIYRAGGPTPLEVFAWYHALAPARIFRAILNAAEAAAGVEARDVDALRAAKVALLGIDRSLAALPAIAAEDDDPRLQFLHAHLTRLQKEVEARFPDARAFRREGLDQ